MSKNSFDYCFRLIREGLRSRELFVDIQKTSEYLSLNRKEKRMIDSMLIGLEENFKV